MKKPKTLFDHLAGITHKKVKWEDLRKSAYSTLAARLYLITIPESIPNTLKERSVYYKKYYNRSGKGTPNKFMKSQK